MFALGLLTCVVLRAFSAQAEVVDDFNQCIEFFYENTEPEGMDQNARKICQMYGQQRPMQFGQEEHVLVSPMHSYYATLYSTQHRIPLYSAYVFDRTCKSGRGRTNIWHVEPQISGYPIRNMVREGDLGKLGLDKDVIKISQSVSSDYSFSGYDRGHLNPSSFNCGAGRNATFTLTNAAPMGPRFNRVHWRKWEMTLRSFLLNQHERDNGLATAYIVTGTVPDAEERIPQRENSEDYEEIYERVTVPSHIWTAVCYKHHFDDSESFSFSYMAENQSEEPGINMMSVSDLGNQLSRLYSELSGTQQTVNIFVDGCFGDNNKLNMVKEKFKKLINLPGRQGLHMSTAVQNIYSAVKRAIGSDSQSSEKKVKVKEMTVKLAFDSMNTYYTMAEDLKAFAGSACLITHVKSPVGKLVLRKREVSEWPDAVECLLVPEKQKTAADGSQCSYFETSDFCLCYLGRSIMRCCSSPCLYQPHVKGYRCNSGRTQIECPPQYSLITAKGERCRDDHPCATYGNDYYWCSKVSGGWDYCSPPLWSSKAKSGKFCRRDHACAKYGEDHMWCYTDDEGSHDQCCTSDDCYSFRKSTDCRSAVNGQTCRSDHMCGYHGESYLWCYTDYEDHRDYCCKNCA
ncbi:uncharacterized protein LOC130078236 [Rhinichthys klamathensis goyatoka]|uniref:uncharacterized protein LOC130078236 n=1 Tax=Rhinichthys klamathensis goyatoka TaxID=3034132 RepID=UPI0024B4AA49|nr:uncharacterized protein LOC130078236 [Rhinichthys klamathensis goyatoka]